MKLKKLKVHVNIDTEYTVPETLDPSKIEEELSFLKKAFRPIFPEPNTKIIITYDIENTS